MLAVTPVPEAPPSVAGAINLHGRVIPVVDLRQRFGQQTREPSPDDHLLVVQAHERPAALMVDQVTELLEVPADRVEPPAEVLPGSPPVAGVIRRDEGLILVLDLAQLLPSGWGASVTPSQRHRETLEEENAFAPTPTD